MKKRIIKNSFLPLLISFCIYSCNIPKTVIRNENKSLPAAYQTQSSDTMNTVNSTWRNYFTDKNLIALIDTALMKNQELNMVLREIEISKNEIRARKGEYLPFGNASLGVGADRSGRYTFNGMSEKDVEDREGELPRYVGEHSLLANFSWELDIWRKLHNAKDAAVKRYLASVEGRNFVVTNLVAEIANAYYELLVLDNELDIVQKNISIQRDALEMVKIQKQAARVNQLAVNRFEAQLMNTQNLKYEIQQEITETENKINFLLGRTPQTIERSASDLSNLTLFPISAGIPSQLLTNRADIRKAEQELEASKFDVKVARADFYPNFTLRAGVGFQSFNPVYLINPKSIAFNFLGDAIAPLINRNAIKARYYNASNAQIQAIYKYEQTILNAYTEVMNQLAGNRNYGESFETKIKQVDILSESIEISNSLFKSARADYTEVLLTQREALEAKMELIEIKKKQLNAAINLYKALGGGWR